jgi:DNA-binding response OmpR family regulator
MKKILIVEDDNFISEMYANKFSESGFEVKIAKDGQEALDRAKEIIPDLILLDIVLPKKDGFEVLNDLKKEDILKNTKIIFLTNLSEGENINKGLQSEADAYLIKAHSTPSQIVAKVKEIIKN